MNGRKRWQTEPPHASQPVLSEKQRAALMERWREDLRAMGLDHPTQVESYAPPKGYDPSRGMPPQQWNRWLVDSGQVDADNFRVRVMKRCRYSCNMPLTDIANVFGVDLIEVCRAVR